MPSAGMLAENREWCRDFITQNCIERSGPGERIETPKGGRAKWQLLLRRALYNARFSELMGALLVDQMEERLRGCEWQAAGMDSGAVPVLMAIAAASAGRSRPRNVFSVRKQPKPYGIFNQFEGIALTDVVTVIVDDFVHSGRSITTCRGLLREAGLMCFDDSFCVVGSGLPRVHHLFSMQEIGLA